MQATALDGIKVLDLSDSVAGQYCARMLADYGGEVTLIEPPGGCSLRRSPPFSNAAGVDDKESLLFFHLNCGKDSLVLDPTNAREQKSFLKLLNGADVVVVDAASRFAFDHDACSHHAIVCTVTDFGATGPLAGWRATEIVHQALSGSMNQNGDADREPLFGVGHRASYAAGVAAYIAVLAALHARATIGRGQCVSIDVAETVASMWYPYATQYIYNQSLEKRGDEQQPLGYVKCMDGWIAFWISNDRWINACEALGIISLVDDPRFANPKARIENWSLLVDEIQLRVATRRADEVVASLQAGKLVAARDYRPSDLWTNCAHLQQRDYWTAVPARHGRRTILGPQFRMSGTPWSITKGAPQLGESSGKPDVRVRETSEPHGAFASAAKDLKRPLHGLRILDMTTAFAGPFAGRILAFLGAEVIHVESATRPDLWRHHSQVFNPRRYPDRVAGKRPYNRISLFNTENINKLSLTIDLKKPLGAETFRKLIAKSDVLMANFTPGTLGRLGLGYDELSRIKSDIIVMEMPAFGNTGPMADAGALAPTMELVAGMSGLVAYPGGRPMTTGPAYLDAVGGIHGAAAVLTALVSRQRHGSGQHIEMPQCEAAMQFIGELILNAVEGGADHVPDGNRVDWCSPHDAFPTIGDDEWLVIAARTEDEWQALARAIGRTDLIDNPNYATLAQRKTNEDSLYKLIAAWTQQHHKHDAATLLQRAGVASAPVQNARDFVASSYLNDRGFFTELVHPEAGTHRYPGLPFHLSATPGSQRTAAPCLGQHTLDILKRIAGISDEDIALMQQAGTIEADPFAKR